jgi:hypothetical protein
MAAVVAALGFVLELPIRGLVATSGALAIVLGLAIQSTLSDVFAGVVLNTTEPYQVGDFIVVDGIEGQVVEMNWRATHLLNGQGNTVIVPNAVVSKTKITNNSRPPNVHGVKVGLELDPGLVPHAVLGALDDACAACADLLPAPKPIATIKQMSTTSVQYEVTAYVASASEKIQAFNGLFDLCHRHLAAAGMRPRVLGIAANGEPDNPNLTVMSHSAIFSMTGIDERIALAEKLSARRFRKGEVLSAAGQTLDELHLVKNGVLSATTLVNDEQKHVRRLGPGDTFGELSVLAMRPETQTYSALTDGIVLVLDGKSFAALAQANREFLDAVCDALHDRDELASAKPDGLQTPASGQSLVEWLVEKVKSIHALAF